jgi:hypothetical protein
VLNASWVVVIVVVVVVVVVVVAKSCWIFERG